MPFIRKAAGDALSLNLENDQHYVAQRSEADGLRDLHALAKNSTVEEVWVFVDARDNHGKSVPLWYEIGTEERAGTSEFNLQDLDAVVDDVKAQGLAIRQWTVTHIHPSGGNPNQSATPSEDDVRALLWLESRFEVRQSAWNVPRPSKKIVTPAGMWSMRYTKSLPKEDSPQGRKFLSHVATQIDRLMYARIAAMQQCWNNAPCTLEQKTVETIRNILNSAYTVVSYEAFGG